MDKITAIRIKKLDGTYSNEIPLVVKAENVDWDGTYYLDDIMGNFDINDGTVKSQIEAKVDKTITVNGHALSGNVTVSAADTGAIPTSAKGAASGVCPLNSSSLVDSTYLPSFVDTVVEAYPRTGITELTSAWLSETSGGSALTPTAGEIYTLMSSSTNYSAGSQFRWGGSVYVQILPTSGVSPMTENEILAITRA